MQDQLNIAKKASASAPGRLDVMGGIADYSGSLLLQIPIKERTYVNIHQSEDDQILIISRTEDKKIAHFPLGVLYNDGLWHSTLQIQELVDDKDAWSLYVLGSIYFFCQHYRLPPVGMKIHINSDVPIGKGVSSSASLEIAVLLALCNLYQVVPDDQFLPQIAQRAENEIVGAPCGLMDQLAVYWGKSNHLLPLVCQPIQVGIPISIPQGIFFMGVDSGVKHAVSGNPYADARTASFMAYSIVEQSLGTTAHIIEEARLKGTTERLFYRGYIANINLKKYQQDYLKLIPDEITGKDFEEKYGNITDNISVIASEKMYHPKNCGSHAVEENNRYN